MWHFSTWNDFLHRIPSQAAQNVHFNGLEADQHSTKKIFWPALYKLLKAKLIFSMGNYFLIGCASFTAPMFWFFAATHASHYYLTITMQKLPKVPPAAICGVFAALGRRWGHQRGEPPSPTSKIHYDQYNVQHFMPFESRWCFQPTKEYYQTWDFCQKTPQKKILFSEQR